MSQTRLDIKAPSVCQGSHSINEAYKLDDLVGHTHIGVRATRLFHLHKFSASMSRAPGMDDAGLMTKLVIALVQVGLDNAPVVRPEKVRWNISRSCGRMVRANATSECNEAFDFLAVSKKNSFGVYI